jgi:prohibitin 1
MKNLLFVSLMFLLGGCSVVNPGEKGIRLFLGRISPGTVDAGYYVYIPFIRSTPSLSVRVQKDAVETSAASRDIQEVKAHLAINWHVDPLKVDEFYRHVGSEDDAVNNVILPAANEIMKAATSKKTAEEILSKRAELKQEIDDGLRKWLGNYGVLVDDVSLVDVTFTPEFSKAVERKQIAEQEAQQAAYNAQRAVKDAEAEVNRAKGQAESQKLLQASTTPAILQQRAIEKWNGVMPVVMGTGALPLLNLKLGNEGK